MELQRHVSRALHQDHVAATAILKRLEGLLGEHNLHHPADAANPVVTEFLKELSRAIESEIGPHFFFEEAFIFPLLEGAGEGEMCALLVTEHEEILPFARRLVELARLARDAGFAAEVWKEFHGVGAEFIGRLVSHIEKEEMGLLPALDDALSEERDGELAIEFAACR